MTKGILGRKIGMTQVFAENGDLIPVTVIEATPNVVLQKKSAETDGYEAIQVGFEDKRIKLSNKPEQGHVAKAGTAPKRFIREFRNVNVEEYEVGQEVHVIDGPFAGFNGVASEVDNVKQKMTVTVLVFGRETSMELEFSQVERV